MTTERMGGPLVEDSRPWCDVCQKPVDSVAVEIVRNSITLIVTGQRIVTIRCHDEEYVYLTNINRKTEVPMREDNKDQVEEIFGACLEVIAK